MRSAALPSSKRLLLADESPGSLASGAATQKSTPEGVRLLASLLSLTEPFESAWAKIYPLVSTAKASGRRDGFGASWIAVVNVTTAPLAMGSFTHRCRLPV